MDSLFESSSIKGMKLANRFFRSATWEGMATQEGAVTPQLIDTIKDLARGGVGCIISSHAYVRSEGQVGSRQIGIDREEHIPGFQKMTEAVHEENGKIIMQLSHAGHAAVEPFGKSLWVVSNFDGLTTLPRKEMTLQDIHEIVHSFAESARRAKAAGFDGVQLHSAHGYLLNQFLSPVWNRRRDRYGGEVSHRVRIHLEICEAIRQTVGKDYPLFIKLNCRDFIENGLTLEDSLEAAKLLIQAGIDAIELSGDVTHGKLSPFRKGINSEEKEAYFREEAKTFKKQLQIPIILVGGIRSFGVAERLVEEGVTDYISMSRPFIREPGLINRWKTGDLRRATCLSDNQCFQPAIRGEGIYCVVDKQEKK